MFDFVTKNDIAYVDVIGRVVHFNFNLKEVKCLDITFNDNISLLVFIDDLVKKYDLFLKSDLSTENTTHWFYVVNNSNL